MNPRHEPAWQVSISPGGDTTKRQHIESAASSGDAGAVVQYVRQRVAPTDIVTANYGPVVAPGGDFDMRTLKEATNTPPDDWDAPMRSLTLAEAMQPITLALEGWAREMLRALGRNAWECED
ncbi:MAG: hypothetical protein LC793_13110 [Thermomicrobia bacterium]|nr:hypothetical protein [Thermomicrobia bacterium]MCA1723333.1 hypothetical protein [Thermomicrobia bacterium]